MRILIVENDERIVDFMKRGLEAEEHEVDIAGGKAQTFDLIKAHVYDLIILDIFLGPDDGIEICQTLRQQHVQSPVLIMTAKGTPETEMVSMNAGANAFLAKPFAFDDLIATINRLGTPTVPSASPTTVVESHRASEKQTNLIYETLQAPSNGHSFTRNDCAGISQPVHRQSAFKETFSLSQDVTTRGSLGRKGGDRRRWTVLF